MNSKLLITLTTFVFLTIGTYVAIQWARGYRFVLDKNNEPVIAGRGLLAANSIPKGASIYINDKLESATDDSLHLPPGDYQVRFEKDGYSSWSKLLKIEQELVTQANARLFPAVPNLSALTLSGARDIRPSPNGQKLAFKVASSSAEVKQGIWVLNLNENPLRFGSNSIQIIKDTPTIKFSKAKLFWAPNSTQLLAYFNDNQMYLLNATAENKVEGLLNAAFQVGSLVTDWHQQLYLERQRHFAKLPDQMQMIATTSASLLYFSPNQEKLLYVATASATLADHLIPPLPAINSQPQTRTLESGTFYIYDLKEDTNFRVMAEKLSETDLRELQNLYTIDPPQQLQSLLETATESASLAMFAKAISQLPVLEQLHYLQAQYSPIYSHNRIQWFPDSYHLILTKGDEISIVEYDGTNDTRIYGGPFQEAFAYPWPNGDKLIILTSLTADPKVIGNLYGVGLE